MNDFSSWKLIPGVGYVAGSKHNNLVEYPPGLLEWARSVDFKHKVYPYQENVMSMFEKGRKTHEAIEAFVDLYPENTVALLDRAAVERLKEADPSVSVMDILKDALEKATKEAEAKRKAELDEAYKTAAREVNLLRASAYVDNAKVRLQEAEVLLDGGIDSKPAAIAADRVLRSMHTCVCAAGRHVRSAYGISQARPGRPHQPSKGRFVHKRREW